MLFFPCNGRWYLDLRGHAVGLGLMGFNIFSVLMPLLFGARGFGVVGVITAII